MDAGIKSKWVGALRSGEYQQGHSFFEHDGKFCCLGVLCVVVGKKTTDAHGCGNWSVPNDLLHEESLIAVTTASKLASMNDGGMPFEKIADYIDANL